MVVVIAILAAITVVAYRGVANNAQSAALKANLSQAATKLETYKIDNSGYPPDQATVAGLVKFDPSTILTYAASNTTGSPAYCLIATSGTQQFSVSSANNTPSANTCAINLVANPALAIGSTSWSLYGGAGGTVSGALDSTVTSGFPVQTSYVETWSVACTDGKGGFFYAPVQVDAGNTYGVSVYAQSSVTRKLTLRIDVKNSTGGTITSVSGPSVAVTAGVSARLSQTIVTPAAAATLTVSLQGAGDVNWKVGDTLRASGLMVTEGSNLYNYADGNSPGWNWTGTPNASTSFGPPL